MMRDLRCPSCERVLVWANGALVCPFTSCTRWGRPVEPERGRRDG